MSIVKDRLLNQGRPPMEKAENAFTKMISQQKSLALRNNTGNLVSSAVAHSRRCCEATKKIRKSFMNCK